MKISVPVTTPRSWSARRAKYLLRRVKREPRDSDGIVTAFRDGQVTLRSNRREDGFTNAELEIGYQGIRAGDLVVHGMDAFAGAIGVSESDGKASPVVHAYVPTDDCEPRYYAYLLRHLAQAGFVESLAKGIRQRSTAFDAETLRSLLLPQPDLATQEAIADFLDIESARFKALITKKLRLVELLKLRENSRTAQFLSGEVVGHQALDSPQPLNATNSVAPSAAPEGVRLRDGWKWVRFDTVFHHIDERSTTGTETLLSVSKVHGVVPRDKIADRPPRAESLIGYKRCRKGDFIVNQMSAYDGLMGISPEDGIVTYHYLVFRPYQPVDLRFVQLLLTSEPYRQDFSRRVRGLGESTQGQVRTPHIRISDMLQTFLPMPPSGSEVSIANAVSDISVRERSLVDQLLMQVDLLHEYRQALISAAVTGELEIPKVAA